MPTIDSSSAILYTGGGKVQAGVEYANLSGTGNSIVPSEAIGISINRCPFVTIPAFQAVLVASTYTYSFEKDTTLLYGNFVVPDFYITHVDYNTADIALDTNTETATICTVVDSHEVTNGEIAALVYVSSTSNQDESLVIRIYDDGTLIHTSQNIDVPSNVVGMNAVTSYEFSGISIAANSLITFTVEATDNDIAIIGSNTPSQLKMVRKNL